MLLKYTGKKPVKTVSYNDKIFTFMPAADGKDSTCEVNDVNTLKYLLGPDMQGLFVPAASKTSKDKASDESATQSLKETVEGLTGEVEELKKKNKALEEDNQALKDENKALAKDNKAKDTKIKKLESK